ncbi:laccase domain-containing protein [Candidatus Saccharibacteria bacterium]|nr:laccase domain-containing protein [Candidatus Saccharibacteria bacterium]
MKVFDLWDNNVRIVLTDKSDGNMRAIETSDADEVARNQNALLDSLDLSPSQVARILSTYDTDNFIEYIKLDSVGPYDIPNAESMPRSDGILTPTKDLGMFLPLADCLGIVLFDPAHSALMTVHSGRHNLEQYGAQKAVEFMRQEIGSDPKSILAWFSPSAGKHNYPMYKFNNHSLEEVALEQLARSGVPENNVILSSVDTTTNDSYFSHSSGDHSKRFAILALMPKRKP